MVSRHFVRVAERTVFYRRHGSGPPVLLIHSSPASSEFLVPLLQALGDRFTCFAPDSPGFGDSEPMASPVSMAMMADAVAALATRLGLGRVPVFGTHTGACVALELAHRHPGMVEGLVLDGLPLFTEEECADLLPGYMMQVQPCALGSHFTALWTRFRDQFIWFPWTRRRVARLMTGTIDGGAPVHRWMMMMLRAGDAYREPYEAAWRYAPDGLRALSALQPPALFLATGNDMLFPHLDRFPPLRDDQRILRLPPNDPQAYQAAISQAIERFAASHAAPAIMAYDAAAAGATRQMVGDAGAQCLVRSLHRDGTRPLLLLHDLFETSHALDHRLRTAERTIIVPDLPGAGDSDPLPDPTLQVFAAALLVLLDGIGIAEVDIEARGWSGAIALALARAAGDRVGAVRLDRPLSCPPGQQAEYGARLAPEIAIEPTGAHWYRAWLMLRDAEVYDPWYCSRKANLKRTEGEFDADILHARTVELMKQPLHYRDLLLAVLATDLEAEIAACHVAVRID